MKKDIEPESDATNLTPDQIRGSKIAASWRQLADEIDKPTKNQIGKLYIQYGLGLGPEVAKGFADPERVNNVYGRVGLAQSAVTTNIDNLKIFWRKIREIAPDLIPSDDDLTFLIEKGTGIGPFYLIMNLAWGKNVRAWGPNPTSVLDTIIVNAVEYK